MKNNSFPIPSAAAALITAALLFGPLRVPVHGACGADTATKQDEQAALLALFPSSGSGGPTVTSAGSGNWGAGSTWSGGQVPGAGARVRILAGHTVTYNVNSGAVLNWVRVDGVLKFQESGSTRLVLDSLFVAPEGTLHVGTPANPITGNVLVEFPGDTDIDTVRDPKVFSRGLIAMGVTRIQGQAKTAWARSAVDRQYAAGESTVYTAGGFSGWANGDEIVLTGTSFNRGDANVSKDDVRTILGISGAQVQVDPLEFAHTFPAGYGFSTYVGNLTRNVVFRTLNGEDVPAQRRAHAIFMHCNNAEIRNARFSSMGRTDKDVLVTDPGAGFVEDGKSPARGSTGNPRGRYSLHLHRCGTSAAEEPIRVQGVVVDDGVGWGIVVHESYAEVEDCVSFRVFGAHYVTEDETELAVFRRNLAVSSKGSLNEEGLLNGPTDRDARSDLGVRGMGFWLDSPYSVREFTGNVVSGCKGEGILLYGHDDGNDLEGNKHGLKLVGVSNLPASVQALFPCATQVQTFKVPWGLFQSNVIFNARAGMSLNGPLRDDTGADFFSVGHQTYGVIDRLNVYLVREYGVGSQYQSRTEFKDCVLIGNLAAPIQANPPQIQGAQAEGYGIFAQKNARGCVVRNCRVQGFQRALCVGQTAGQGFREEEESKTAPWRLIGGVFANNNDQLFPGPGRYTDQPTSPFILSPPFPAYFQIEGNPSFTTLGANQAPTAEFTAQGIGGYAVQLDGSASSDPDYPLGLYDGASTPWGDPAQGGWADENDNTLACYAWDIGNDGTMDGYGRYFVHVFPSGGQKTVRLVVYDSDGATAVRTKQITVAAVPFPDIVGNGVLDAAPDSNSGASTPGIAGDYVLRLGRSNFAYPSGRKWNWANSEMYADNSGAGGVIQLVRDEKVLRGLQTLRFSAINSGGDELRATVWGVGNPYFSKSNWDTKDPKGTSATEPPAVARLFDVNFNQVRSAWETIEQSVDVGSGHEYYVIQYNTSGVGSGENQRIDNVQFGGAGGGAPPTGPETDTFEDLPEGNQGTATLTRNGFLYRTTPVGGGSGAQWKVFGPGNHGYPSKGISDVNNDRKLLISRADGAPFDLIAFDHARSPYGNADALVTGRYAAGGTVTASIAPTSLTFVTATLNWTGLSEVEINYGESGGANKRVVVIDNVVAGH